MSIDRETTCPTNQEATDWDAAVPTTLFTNRYYITAFMQSEKQNDKGSRTAEEKSSVTWKLRLQARFPRNPFSGRFLYLVWRNFDNCRGFYFDRVSSCASLPWNFLTLPLRVSRRIFAEVPRTLIHKLVAELSSVTRYRPRNSTIVLEITSNLSMARSRMSMQICIFINTSETMEKFVLCLSRFRYVGDFLR